MLKATSKRQLTVDPKIVQNKKAKNKEENYCKFKAFDEQAQDNQEEEVKHEYRWWLVLYPKLFIKMMSYQKQKIIFLFFFLIEDDNDDRESRE